MRASILLSTAALTVSICARDRGDKSQAGRPTHGRRTKYIVELEQPSQLGAITRKLADARPNQNGTVPKAFDCGNLFHGLELDSDEDDIAAVRAMEGVVNVWQSGSIPFAPPIDPAKRVEPSRLGNYSMHQWTGVNKLHREGVRGKGVRVAVIDTGIDYTHKALGGGFGPGYKIVGGYDLVGANWSSSTETILPKQPDADPMDGYGHGTHVAGIIAAENSWLVGVAPDVEILNYKVFADDPVDTSEEVLIQAFCDAYSAGADVITASIGKPSGYTDEPWARVAARIVEQGVVVVIAAGNEGFKGPIYASSGSNGPNVLSVAAINVTGDPRLSTKDPKNAPYPSYYTTWGPTNELFMKPDIGAPGEEVVSTVLNQEYAALGGTSMAAPYVAGVAALYIGEHGGRSVHGPDFAKRLYRRIASSGNTVEWCDTVHRSNLTAPPFQVGTGLIDAYKVLRYDTEMNYRGFALNDTINFESDWSVNISNNGNSTVRYTFEQETAPGINLYDPSGGIVSLYKLKPTTIKSAVQLPQPINIPAGETRLVNFTFALPEGVSDDYLPLYSGKILVKGNNQERLAIPYGGAAFDVEKAFDSMFAVPPLLTDHEPDNAWSFNIKKDPFDYIAITFYLSYPCTNMRWDIYDAYWQESFWQYPPAEDENGYIGSATSVRAAETEMFFDPDSNDINDLKYFPQKQVARGYNNYWWMGKLANGSMIQPGNYTMRFAALRPYGNPNISDHWDVMVNKYPTFEVLPFGSSNLTSNSTVPWPRIRAH